ncbi:hypothetical protein JCM10295v2_006727 [Rhodotorula toruloides]
MLAALRHARSPPPFPREERAPHPTSAVKPESVTGPAAHADDDDDDDVESLLYLAQMDLIAHKPEQATAKLQQAVDLGSSAACATLANLLARGWRADTSRPALSSPPLAVRSPPATSPPSSFHPPHSYRPRPPLRRYSSIAALSAPRRTADSQRAVGLFCTGLEVELRKPVRRDTNDHDPVESGYGSGEDDDSAEGRFFSLERALDLVVGVTDAHRFGILHAPHTQQAGQLPSPTDQEGETNDQLWRRSSQVASDLLEHEAVAPVLHPLPAPDEQQPPTQRRRPSSVSRSYTHPSSALIAAPSSPADSQTASLFSPKRKLQLTIAIHALYTLAVQSYASSSSTLTSPSQSSSPSDAEKHWSTMVALAKPYAPLGGIGIKEADELVERAGRRLESIHHLDMGEQEPWRLAKRKDKGKQRQEEGVLGTSAVTIRPVSVRSTTTATAGSFGGRTPRVGSAARFHLHGEVDEGDEALVSPAQASVAAMRSGLPAAAADCAHSPPFSLSPPKNLLTSPVHSNHSSAPSSKEEAALQYPSPPDTPPTEFPSQLQPLSPSQLQPASSLSPPLSSVTALSPFYPPDRSRSPSSSGSAIPRVTSTRSIRSTHSVLSTFKNDPLQSYLDLRLKRVTSSASICTAPPDFSARLGRYAGKDKGKGRMVGPEPVVGFAVATNGRVRARAQSTAPRPPQPEPGPTNWLSRFWSTTKNLKDWPAETREAEGEGVSDLDRSRSSSAMHELRKALKRHEEASGVLYSYWGEGDLVEEEEADGAEQQQEEVVPAAKFDSPAVPPQASTSGESAQAARLRESLAKAVGAGPRRRTASGPRSFALNDPTATLDPSSSRGSSHERDRSSPRQRRHNRQHSGSSATLTATTVDGFLAPPSPVTRHRRRKSEPRPLKPVAMDPLLLELEKRSRVGVQTVCAACGKRGLNFPACRKCKRTYCGRTCRIGQKHSCATSPSGAREKAKVQG